MRVIDTTLVLAASMAVTPPALSAENCSPRPDAWASIPVNHITQNSELSNLFGKLDAYLKLCLSPFTEQNRKSFGRMTDWRPISH